MNLNQLHKSLYLHKRHICCDEAEYYLFPPNKATDGFVNLNIGQANVRAINYWYLDNSEGGAIIPAKFCPFCGIRLERSNA